MTASLFISGIFMSAKHYQIDVGRQSVDSRPTVGRWVGRLSTDCLKYTWSVLLLLPCLGILLPIVPKQDQYSSPGVGAMQGQLASTQECMQKATSATLTNWTPGRDPLNVRKFLKLHLFRIIIFGRLPGTWGDWTHSRSRIFGNAMSTRHDCRNTHAHKLLDNLVQGVFFSQRIFDFLYERTHSRRRNSHKNIANVFPATGTQVWNFPQGEACPRPPACECWHVRLCSIVQLLNTCIGSASTT